RRTGPPSDDAGGRSITAATAAAAAAAAAVTATTTVAATAAARLAGLGLVDRQATSVDFLIVQALDGRLRLGVPPHLPEAEPLAPTRVAILDDLCALHGPEFREQLLQVGIADLVGQVPDIQFPAHHHAPRRGVRPDEHLTGRIERADSDGPAGGKARGAGETESRRIGVAGSFVFQRT